jgi:hypothetical protein
MLKVARLTISGGLLVLLLLTCARALAQAVWVPQAPGPNTRGQVENITDKEVVGAINTVAAHPTDANIIYVGAVNGGIWRTNNATAANPNWQSQTDGHLSQSIGAIEFDPTDATNRTLVAGIGRFSSFGADGGIRSGLLRTTDGGADWAAIEGDDRVLSGLNIWGVAPRGATIVIAANEANTPSRVGVWRSTDTGRTWRQTSGGSGTGLPSGPSFDLASDPTNRDRLFTNGGRRGIFRSTDAGATWVKVSNTAMDALTTGTVNIKMSVGANNNVYVAIVGFEELAGIFRSGDGGTSWAALDLPMTDEGGIHPGGQGDTHLSIAADRLNHHIVYIGGDRQPSQMADGEETNVFPNSIDARDYSGRLFRGDASKPRGSQFVHLTHSNSEGAEGGGTASNSAPHADSRDMAIDASGVLIEVDDGGVYRRTNPQTNAGDWFSMNGDLQATEFHAIAWDANADVVIGGAQDTGTPEQAVRSNVRWRSVSTGDGGVVAVDDSSSTSLSTRYSSFQFLISFKRQVFNTENVFLSEVRPSLTVVGEGDPPDPQFYTPIKLNTVTPTRLIIGAKNGVYESLNQGDTITRIGSMRINGTGANPIAYGARGNPDVLYVGSDARVFVRKSASPATLTQSIAYTGGFVVGIAIDPNDPRTAYVIDQSRVFRTTNAGDTWANITGNLAALNPGRLRTVAFNTSTFAGVVVVGGDNGVFQAPGAAFTTWDRPGTGLPRVPVYHLEYDVADNILLAGTLGRGAWTLMLPPPAPPIALGPGPAQPGALTAARESARLVSDQRVRSPQAPARQPPVSTNAVQLRPGVIINPAQRHVYIISPTGGIEAVELTGGAQVWSTRAAAKPLGLTGQRLIGQAETRGAENNLTLVVLDPATGSQRLTQSRALPLEVSASVNKTMRGEFRVTAQPAGGEVIVTWQYLNRPLKGVRPRSEGTASPTESTALPPRAPTPVRVRTGAFRLNPSTGAISTAVVDRNAIPESSRMIMLSLAERIPALPANQLLSADGRHVLVSEVAGDQQAWEKYRLTVYRRDMGERVGEFRSHLAMMPFFVTGSIVIFETGPYVRATQAGEVAEPLKIRAVDLRTGSEVWSREVRDTAFRGSFPP